MENPTQARHQGINIMTLDEYARQHERETSALYRGFFWGILLTFFVCALIFWAARSGI